ncbi:MAG: outer membrane beta-barrel protein [Gammaproteobacteria bacterium]|nr:outer membrane beta-barrel protein [Gammaproteobacteria bacterium]
MRLKQRQKNKSGLVGSLFITSLGLSLTSSPTFVDGEIYGRLIGGLNGLSDSDLDSTFSAPVSGEYDAGFAAGGAFGYDLGAIRLEGEIMYRSNDIDKGTPGSLPAGTKPGDFSSLGIGINALYDFDLGGNPNSQAYVGGGLVYLEEIDIDFEAPSGELSYSDSGYQLIAGARYDLDKPWHLIAEFRYLDAGSVTLNGEGSASERVTSDYDTTSLLFGVGYTVQ